jgi:selenocysteine lyase/cysteine desulfurase
MGASPREQTVLKARPWSRQPGRVDPRADRRGGGHHPGRAARVVFAPHVETAAGMILPDDYLRAVADAVHEVGGLFVLDCIASGAIWVDMQATGSTC